MPNETPQQPGSSQQDLARRALEAGGIKLSAMDPHQQAHALAAAEIAIAAHRQGLASAQGGAGVQGVPTAEAFSLDLGSIGCIACKAGLTAVGGLAIAGIIAVGVAVGPETAAVAAIASFFGADATAVAAAINGALAAAGKGGVSAVVGALCSKFGAC